MKKRKILVALFVVLAAIAMIAGCGKKVSVESLLQDTAAKLDAKKSMEADMDMGLKASVSGNAAGTQISLDMDMAFALHMEAIQDTGDSYMKGKVDISMMGLNVSTEMENYTVQEDGKIVSYVKAEDAWTKHANDDSQGAGAAVDNIFKMAADGKVKAELQKDTEKLDDKEVYVVKIEVSGDAIKDLMSFSGEAMDDMFSGGMDIGSDVKIPVTLYINKADSLPAKIAFDMKEFGDALFKQQEDVSADIEKFDMSIVFTGFDTVDEIKVPDDVKDKAEEGSGSSDILDGLGGSDDTSGSDNTDDIKTDENGNYIISTYDGAVTAAIGVPEGMEFSYGSANYVSFDDNDQIDITFTVDDYTSDEDMVSEYSNAEYMESSEDYTDVKTGEIKKMSVNNMEVSYFSESYTFMGDSKCVDYFAWITTEEGAKVICEIECGDFSGEGLKADESIVETAFKAVVTGKAV